MSDQARACLGWEWSVDTYRKDQRRGAGECVVDDRRDLASPCQSTHSLFPIIGHEHS